MELRTYLLLNKIKLGDFAKIVGVSRTHLMDILNGKQDPRLSLALKICKATGEEVTIQDIHAYYAERHNGALE